MNKTSAIYFFSFLIGLFLMIGGMSVIIVAEVRFSFLIVIGLLVIIFLVVISISLSNGTLKQRTTLFVPCIECGEEIDVKSDFCKFCGANQKSVIVCEYCGGECNANDTICKHCNALLK